MEYIQHYKLYDRDICIAVFSLGEGTSVTIFGGDKSHVGAVCVADPTGQITTQVFPGHRDDVIAEQWAKQIYKATRQQVVVSVGIHYDDATGEMIQGIQEFFSKKLEEVLRLISRS